MDHDRGRMLELDGRVGILRKRFRIRRGCQSFAAGNCNRDITLRPRSGSEIGPSQFSLAHLAADLLTLPLAPDPSAADSLPQVPPVVSSRTCDRLKVLSELGLPASCCAPPGVRGPGYAHLRRMVNEPQEVCLDRHLLACPIA